MIRKLLVLSVLGLVIAAIAAPAALAKPVSSNTLNGGYDAWAVGQIYKSTHPGTQNLGPLDPWAYAAIHKTAIAAPGALSRPVGTQNLGPLDPWAYAAIHKTATPPVVTTSSSSGFDYGDAGIGAAVAFGAALILFGTAAVGRKLRRDNLAIS
jgi:hypothetical protein